MALPAKTRALANGQHRRAILLVFSAGLLVLLSVMGVSFYALLHTHSLSATSYSDAMRAETLARSGVQEAIARLRERSATDAEDPSDPWYTVKYLDGKKSTISFPADAWSSYTRVMGHSVGPASDRFTLTVEDAASKINVNSGDALAVLLDNLCRLIGPPLVAADQDLLIPMRWRCEEPAYLYGLNPRDRKSGDGTPARDLAYQLGADRRPISWREFLNRHPVTLDDPDGGRARLLARKDDGGAVYGDGYAVAGYRARNGRFESLADIKHALTYVERNGNDRLDDPLEVLEVEAKYAALAPCLTLDSWVDTSTVGVGKFEWVETRTEELNGKSVTVARVLVDRDKSWIADDPVNDPANQRGSLRGCYLSILNGHGAGQLRRIRTNGADWLEVDFPLVVAPGPLSSYLIMAPEDALVEDVQTGDRRSLYDGPWPAGRSYLPVVDAQGRRADDPRIDHARFPLCIHRAPVNLNTASDKVLAALFLALNVQYGHPMAIGTDADAADIGVAPRSPATYDMTELPRSPLLPADQPYWRVLDTGRLRSFFEKNLAPPTPPGGIGGEAGGGVDRLMDGEQYSYRVTFVTERGETTGSLPPVGLGGPWDGGRVKLGSVPLGAPDAVIGRNIYRARIKQGEDPAAIPAARFRQVTGGGGMSIADNTTTSFVDQTSEAGLGGSLPDKNTAGSVPRLIGQEPYLLTARGLKRIPANSGRLVLGRPAAWTDRKRFGYLDNYATLTGNPYFLPGKYMAGPRGAVRSGGPLKAGTVSEALELVYRILVARETEAGLEYIHKETGMPQKSATDGYTRGPFVSWDDLFMRVIKPWDDQRCIQGWEDVNGNGKMDGWEDANHDGKRQPGETDVYHKASVARMLMAHFNSNTDVLKFNPNIEWIDRWGRNFTEMEPVMVYDSDDPGGDLAKGNPVRPRFNEMMWWPDRGRAPNDGVRDDSNAPSSEMAYDTSVNPYLTRKGLYTDFLRTSHTDAELTKFIGWEDRLIKPGSYNSPRIFGKCLKWMDAVWCRDLVDTLGRARGSYVARNFRYKSDEMIDKTDLNRTTTELSFHSNGLYSVVATGQLLAPHAGQLLAERQFSALVKVYDVWHESTQADFVNGTLSPAAGAPGSPASGQVTRDSDPGVHRRALLTLPEPLVPLGLRLQVNPHYRDVVDSAPYGHDAFGRTKSLAGSSAVPDVVANRVLPARYDGQITLATNTAAYDTTPAGDSVTFLASFNGDLDTDTCLGNGREQAKTPSNRAVRVLDTVGLLGLLNDTQVDFDPKLFGDLNASPDWIAKLRSGAEYADFRLPGRSLEEVFDTFAARKNSAAMRALIPGNWWENVTCRMGDLRPDGVNLGPVGVSGKDGTLKYLMDLYKRAERNRTWYRDSRSPDDMTRDNYALHERFRPKPGFRDPQYPSLQIDVDEDWRADGGGYAMDFNKSFNDYWKEAGDDETGFAAEGGKKSRALIRWVEKCYRDWFLGNREERLGRFRNFQINSPDGVTVTMWFKPNWHGTDGQEHEFLNASNPGYGAMARCFQFVKLGRFSRAIPHGLFVSSDSDSQQCPYAGRGGDADRYDNLRMETADWNNWRMAADIYGGTHGVVYQKDLSNQQRLIESPAFRAQPFRWGCTGFNLAFGRKTRVITPLEAWTWGESGWGWSQKGYETVSSGGTSQPKVYPPGLEPFADTPMVEKHIADRDRKPEEQQNVVGKGYYSLRPVNKVPQKFDVTFGYREAWDYTVSPWDTDTPLLGKRRNEILSKIVRPFVSTQRIPPPGTDAIAWERDCDGDPEKRYFKWMGLQDEFYRNWDGADMQGQYSPEASNSNNEVTYKYEIRYILPNQRRLAEDKYRPGEPRYADPKARRLTKMPAWSPPKTVEADSPLSDYNTVPLDKPFSKGGKPIFTVEKVANPKAPQASFAPWDDSVDGRRHMRCDDDSMALRLRMSDQYINANPSLAAFYDDRHYSRLDPSAANWSTYLDLGYPDLEGGRYFLLIHEYNDPEKNYVGRPDFIRSPWDKGYAGWQNAPRGVKPVKPYPQWSPHATDEDPDQGQAGYTMLEECDIGDPHPSPYGKIRKSDNSGFVHRHTNSNLFDCGVGGNGDLTDADHWIYPQSAAWPWADGGEKIKLRSQNYSGRPFDETELPAGSSQPVFSINNLNGGLINTSSVLDYEKEKVLWIHRTNPSDATNAVVDELRLTNKQWTNARVEQEMCASRYYLPGSNQPAPTFTSQTLMQALRGADSQDASARLRDGEAETVVLGRVMWNVFTPRFMHENKEYKCARFEVMGCYTRDSRGNIKFQVSPVLRADELAYGPAPRDAQRDSPAGWNKALFRGPFDYIQYNYERIRDTRPVTVDYMLQLDPAKPLDPTWTEAHLNVFKPALGVNRPSRADYEALNVQPHATRGVELELLDGSRVVSGSFYDPAGKRYVSTTVFRNPDVVNRFLDANGKRTAESRVRADRLRYRVRFRYPVDQLVKRAYDPSSPLNADQAVDPAQHFLLDTPVFDDISILYYARLRILDLHEATE